MVAAPKVKMPENLFCHVRFVDDRCAYDAAAFKLVTGLLAARFPAAVRVSGGAKPVLVNKARTQFSPCHSSKAIATR